MKKVKTNVADRCDQSGKSGLKPYVVGKNRTFNTVKEVCKHLRISVSYFYPEIYQLPKRKKAELLQKRRIRTLKAVNLIHGGICVMPTVILTASAVITKVKSSDFDSEHFNFEKVKALDENSRKPSPLDYHAIPRYR